MYVTPEVKARVTAKLNESIARVKAKYGVELRFPTVVYQKRGTTAGTANYVKWILDFNPVLLMENVDAFLERTVPHELAHLACDKIYPDAHRPGYDMFSYRRAKREVHGPRWQEIMLAIGADPKRCHSYDTSNSKVVKSNGRNVQWRCGCGELLMLSEKKSALLRANPHALWHRSCKGLGMTEVKATTRSTPAPVFHDPYRLLPPATRAPAPAPVRTPVIIPERFVSRAGSYAPAQEQKRATEAPGSKLEKCANLYVSYQHLGRQMVISMFVQEAGCTPAGAATYYATMKKRYA